MTNASQEIILRSLVFAGAYATHTFNGQTGPEVCRWLFDVIKPEDLHIQGIQVYNVYTRAWWKAFDFVYQRHGHLDEMTFQADMQESELFEWGSDRNAAKMAGAQRSKIKPFNTGNVGLLYLDAAQYGWRYLSDMSGLRGHVDRVLEAAKR